MTSRRSTALFQRHYQYIPDNTGRTIIIKGITGGCSKVHLGFNNANLFPDVPSASAWSSQRKQKLFRVRKYRCNMANVQKVLYNANFKVIFSPILCL